MAAVSNQEISHKWAQTNMDLALGHVAGGQRDVSTRLSLAIKVNPLVHLFICSVNSVHSIKKSKTQNRQLLWPMGAQDQNPLNISGPARAGDK
jgi:hypothetical protein